jgi:hypothetical protein
MHNLPVTSSRRIFSLQNKNSKFFNTIMGEFLTSSRAKGVVDLSVDHSSSFSFSVSVSLRYTRLSQVLSDICFDVFGGILDLGLEEYHWLSDTEYLGFRTRFVWNRDCHFELWIGLGECASVTRKGSPIHGHCLARIGCTELSAGSLPGVYSS